MTLYAATCANPSHLGPNGQPFVTTTRTPDAKPVEMGPDCVVLLEELAA